MLTIRPICRWHTIRARTPGESYNDPETGRTSSRHAGPTRIDETSRSSAELGSHQPSSAEALLKDRTGPPMKTRDLRIESIRPLISPAILLEELPLTDAGSIAVSEARDELVRILDGEDDRLIVVVGPCSIHDPEAGLEYGRRLKLLADELADDLCVVMRVYFEKPRTTIGWKGLINDPHLNGSPDIETGLKKARKLLLELTSMGLPTATEFLDPIIPQYTADLVTWAAIGARTTESQTHREMASGLSMPVGFKNSTDGSLQTAIDALSSARTPHSFLGINADGQTSIIKTMGNPDRHIVLRGGG